MSACSHMTVCLSVCGTPIQFILHTVQLLAICMYVNNKQIYLNGHINDVSGQATGLTG